MNYSQFGFKKSDFNGLTIPVHQAGEDDNLFHAFPILNKYEEFNPSLPKRINKQNIIRYVIITFDQKSPLKMKYPDPIERRIKAGHIVGFETKDTGEFTDTYTSIIKSEVVEVNKMVILYMYLQNENDMLTLIAYEEALRMQASKLVEGTADEKTKDIISNVDTLRKAIETLKRSFIEVEEDTLLKRDLFNYTQSKKLKIKPEDYAEMFVIGENHKTGLINVGEK